MPSKIEWTDEVWNPVTGCTPVSEGCRNCYAKRMAHRLAGRYGYPKEPREFDVTLRPERLEQPLRWRKPRRVFPCSMSDLFHKGIPPWFVCEVWRVMRECPQHTFQILTKRPGRMLRLIKTYIADHEFGVRPLPNVHLGVSVENQATADERREYLRQCPAAVKYVSYEPALGPVDWTGWEFVSQIISGGESGPGARPSHPDWHRVTRDFCQENGIAYFMKQWGHWQPVDQSNELVPGNTREYTWEDGTISFAIGKHAAGHLLDGRTWQEFPKCS